ncbi:MULTISPECIES: hypothetical protein [unclassified Coleofasciculus]|uniref:hypothetical protein n=1 Tax=unclassified Coleofasciculus TaxID=2692782 RepID=UPI001880360A|nr:MULTISPECIES: hypothetical protein [unclassified Coleofasciculus]MBE9126246.1 hypothetical protein [Coleofasciculus sp. LEGE 07081]MBE9148135.1 hypothetical protein [Coleofasciculus sp. LEGE 07092]
MSKLKILQEGVSYTFRSYFELPNDTDEVLAEFGYRFERQRLQLPTTTRQIDGLPELQQQLEETIPYVTLSSETAKREILIAPVLTRVAVMCRRLLRIEYPLKVNEQLQGNLDYFIQSERGLIVIEAKRDDVTRGFTQLAVELIALAMVEESPEVLYGVVSIGELWIFGKLERSNYIITRDIGSYTLPDDLAELVRILVGILE